MNSSYILELLVCGLGLALLLIDLWTPTVHKQKLGYIAAAGLLTILGFSFFMDATVSYTSFNGMLVYDPLALFFKRFFLSAAVLVTFLAIDFSDRISHGIGEYYSLLVFALAGMLFASSANDLIMVFVSLELITVTFYVLTSFQHKKTASIEAGVKYLILGALSSGFMVYGIALVFGTANTTEFSALKAAAITNSENPIFLMGLLFVIGGLAFKIAAFPFQLWAPDVYQGSPVPTTAFLAIGSKAAGFALLLRLLCTGVPNIAEHWNTLLIGMAGVTILYGNLCAIPQRNLKRLLGYSSIANAGYLLIGVSVLSQAGISAVLYYFCGYMFTLIAAFGVISILSKQNDSEDISILVGLNQRSPFLAATLTLAMVSLAGIPPLAGFFGKFLLLSSALERAPLHPAYYALLLIAIIGVVISIYYYFGVVRAIYWGKDPGDLSPVQVQMPARIALVLSIVGMIYLGLLPDRALKQSQRASSSLPTSAIVHKAAAAH